MAPAAPTLAGPLACMLVMISVLTVGLVAEELRSISENLHDEVVATLVGASSDRRVLWPLALAVRTQWF